MENREAVTIESTQEPQPQEVAVQEQPVAIDASTEASAEAGKPVDLDLKVDTTPTKTVDQFFEQDYDRIMDAVVSNGGQFTDELYAEFEKNGHSRAVADRLLEAEVAKATLRTQQVVNSVGGQEIAQKALQWAAENLSEAQTAVVNKQLQSPNVEVSTMALKSLIAQSGAATTMVSADTAMTGGMGYFQNEADFDEAVRDEVRMQEDAYRQQVMSKLQRSIEMGLIQG